jgi:hypothetical protein
VSGTSTRLAPRARGKLTSGGLAALVALALGCASSAPPLPPPPPEASWFPVVAGRTWTFEHRRDADVSRGVFRLEATEAADTFTLVVQNPSTGKFDRVRLRSEGESVTIFWASGRFDLLRGPLEAGRTWFWEDKGRRTDAAVIGVETIPVLGRPTPCFHVRYTSRGVPTQEYWFARGVGWVRIQMTVPGEPPDVRELVAT